MKIKALLATIAGVVAVAANAQNFKCEDNFKALQSTVKAKDYATATENLLVLRKKCPKYGVALYTTGEKVLVYNAETSRSEESIKANRDTLLFFYDQWEKNLPATGGVQKKALYLKDQELAKDDEVFKMLNTAFEAKKESFTDFAVLELYYSLYLARYEAGEKEGVNKEQFVEKFVAMAGQAANAKAAIQQRKQQLLSKKQTQPLEEEETAFLKEAPQTISALDAVIDNMVMQSERYITCQMLDVYYGTLYEKNKENPQWLNGMVTVLSVKKCNNSLLLYNAALENYKAAPTADNALLMGNLALKKEPKAAAGYFEKAAAMEADSVSKSKIYMMAANSLRNSDKAAAKAALLKAAAFNHKSGSPYIQLAEMYTSATDCGLNAFEQKAVYWLAIETLKKAEIAEPKYKATTAGLLKRYEPKLPKKADLKAAKVSKGDTVTFNCWINETITVPKVK